MAKKIRILVFTTAYRPMIGGSEIALEEVICRLPASPSGGPDIFFDIVTPRHSGEFKPFELGSNFCVHRVGPGFESAKIIFPVLGFIKAMQLTKSNSYDAVHAYQASYGGGAAWLVKLFYPEIKFILTLQEGKILDKQNVLVRFFRGLIIKKADTITAISTYLKEYAQKVSKNKDVFLIPNGVDLDKFQISQEKLQINFKFPNLKDKTIITISRLVEKNGIGDLIMAMAKLVNDKSMANGKWQMENLKLVIVGDGPLREDLELQITNYKLEDKVKIIGKVSPEEIPKYLAQADIFVRPSLSEGLGTAFLEAMAAGLPIVATPVGGIPDFLKDPSTHSGQATGLFCKVNNPEDIAEKINRILTDDELKNRLIINGRKLVEEKYTWDKIAAQFKNLYNSLP